MTNKEMTKRIETIPASTFANVVRMIKEGYGAHGISLESTATLKQINAVFQMVQGK